MAFLEVGNEGALNGTTLVDVMPAPAAATRRLLKNVKISNRDSVSHTVVLYKDKAATQYEIARELLAPGDYWTFTEVVVCDATDEKVVAKTLAATTTTAPSFDMAAADAT
jgi:hypothetical protein